MHKGLTSLRDGNVHELQVGQTSRFHSYVPEGLQWPADTDEEEDADAREQNEEDVHAIEEPSKVFTVHNP